MHQMHLQNNGCTIKTKMNMDPDTWLGARAWSLWKRTLELGQIQNSSEAEVQKRIMDEVMDGKEI